MDDLTWRRIDAVSRISVQRCIIRFVLILVVSSFSSDFITSFWLFSLLSAVICGAYGASASEKLFGPSLNHWDEALVFLFLSQVVYRFVG